MQRNGKTRTTKTRNSRKSTVARNSGISKIEFRGGKLTPPSNPPDTTIIPWFNYVVVDTFTNSKNYDVATIADLVRTRMDPTRRLFNWKGTGESIYRIQMKVRAIYAWNLTGKFVVLSVDDYSDSIADKGARDQLCGLIDAGTQLHTPACGYKLPLSTSNVALRNDDKAGELNIAHVSGGKSDTILVHIHISFRADGPVAGFQNDIATLVETNESVLQMGSKLDDLSAIAQALKDIADDSVKNRPSTVKTVWNGLTTIAQVATLATAGDLNHHNCKGVEPETLNQCFEPSIHSPCSSDFADLESLDMAK